MNEFDAAQKYCQAKSAFEAAQNRAANARGLWANADNALGFRDPGIVGQYSKVYSAACAELRVAEAAFIASLAT